MGLVKDCRQALESNLGPAEETLQVGRRAVVGAADRGVHVAEMILRAILFFRE